MKKSLFVLPMIALLAACGGGSKGGDSVKGKQVDLLKDKETLIGAANSLKTVLDVAKSKHVMHLDGELSNGNLEVKLDAVQAVEEGTPDSAKVDLALKNVNGKLEAAVIGQKFDGTQFSTHDLKAYVELSGAGADLALDYKLPNSIYSEEAGLPDSIAMFVNLLAQSGKLNVSARGIGLGAYLDEGNVYLDLTDEKIYTLTDAILHSDIIPSFPAEMDTKQLISSVLMLVLQEEVTYAGKIGVEGAVAEDMISAEIPNLDFTQIITDDNFAEIKEMVAPILESLQIKTYIYGDTSKYSYGVDFTLNKTTLKAIMTLAGADVDLDTVLTAYGVKLNKFENKLSLKLLREGGLELAVELNNDIAMTLPEEARGEAFTSLTASLKLSGKASLSISFDDTFKALPSFTDYIMLPVAREPEPEPTLEPEPEVE